MQQRFFGLLKASRSGLFLFSSIHKIAQRNISRASISFNDLFVHTEKNYPLLHKLKKMNLSHKAISSLRTAIRTGDDKAAVFSDPDCHLYVLHLIRKGQVPFWEGINVYVFLMALMQFTNRQTLDTTTPEAQTGLKKRYDFEVLKLSIDGNLTDQGIAYIAQVAKQMRRIRVDIDEYEFASMICQLSPTDNWLVRCSYVSAPILDCDYNHLIAILSANIPFIALDPNYDGHYYVPSTNVVRWLLTKVSPAPLQLRAVIGLINADTFNDMHEKGLHPAPLYLPGSNKKSYQSA